MKRRLAWTLLALVCLAPAADARKPRCTLRVHADGNANDGEVFSTKLRSAATGKNVAIEKVPTISELDVVAFRTYPAHDGSFGVLIQLNDHGRLALDTLSIDRRGRYVYVFLNGRPLSEMQVDRRVSDGKLYFASGVTAADIELMKKEWPLKGQRKK